MEADQTTTPNTAFKCDVSNQHTMLNSPRLCYFTSWITLDSYNETFTDLVKEFFPPASFTCRQLYSDI